MLAGRLAAQTEPAALRAIDILVVLLVAHRDWTGLVQAQTARNLFGRPALMNVLGNAPSEIGIANDLATTEPPSSCLAVRDASKITSEIGIIVGERIAPQLAVGVLVTAAQKVPGSVPKLGVMLKFRG